MEATYSEFDGVASVIRIEEILGGSENNYQEKKTIPARDQLTFDNGFDVSAAALCVDIRNSSALSQKYTRPKLAKIYRCYISEIVAVLKGNRHVNEIYVEGDGVWAIFDATYQSQINQVFETAGEVSSMMQIMNYRFSKHGIEPLTIGIGLTYADALYIKAGYKGSGINEVVWLGDLVSQAHELCSFGNRTYYDRQTMISSVFYHNLTQAYQGFLSWNNNRNCYHGNIISLRLNKLLQSYQN